MKGKTKHSHLTTEDRMVIQACLHDKRSITQIARRLEVNKSTLSRELKRNAVVKEGSDIPCKIRDLFLVCNTCQKKGFCQRNKIYYNYFEADKKANLKKRQSRSRPKITEANLKMIDEIVSAGVKEGQSLHHVYVVNPLLETICVERTIRRLCYRGSLAVRPYELRRYVTYKRSYAKAEKEYALRDIRVLIGRMFRNYLNYVRHHKTKHVAQYDSLIGKITDRQAILTIAFPKSNFQFGLLIKKGSSVSANAHLKQLFSRLGSETIKRIFPVNLADNGVEFSAFNEIEISENGEKIYNCYFTNPYKATDKAACERNHELVRYVLPKGKSFDALTQETIDEMFSHINSYVRKSKGDKTPYDIVRKQFGKAFLDAINIRRIPKKKVRLRPII